MALPAPILDNRSFEQLRTELVRRIPVYAPEWTDHNESDPGIALLELFAYLGESLLFRFNQIPDATLVSFLRLLGVQPRPAQSAGVLLAAVTERPAGVQILRGTVASAGPLGFETDDETYAWPLDLVAAGKTPREPDDTTAGQESAADALARAGVTDPVAAQFYATTTVSADPLAADAVMVDVSAQVDQALWLALVAKDTTDVTALAGQTVFVGLAFDETITPPLVLEQLDSAGAELFSSDLLSREPPPMTWRLWNGPGAATPFTALRVIGDSTRGLLSSGVVKVVLPAVLPVLDGTTDGGVDAPPPLDVEETAAAVVAWIQLSRPASLGISDAIGRVRWAGVNAVTVTQARTASTELVGTGTGDTDQRYALAHRPVLSRTVRLQVEEPTGWTSWTEVDNFAGSTRDDRHFVCDLDAGEIVFGRHRFPQIGERIRVVGYRYGGGAAGNVPAGSISAFTGVGGATALQPLPAAGGGDRVSLAEALDAIPAEVHRRDRAVIAADFAELARRVPGVRRADTLPRFHPDSPQVEAAGVVSLVIIGPPDPRDPGAPLPDLGLLRRVARYLDARRLVTTELYVLPPEYIRLHLAVGVAVKEGYQADAVRRWVEQILRQYLAALPPHGPEGQGWPLGRDVRRAELEAVAVQVEGVEFLEGLALGVPDPGDPSAVLPSDLVALEKWQLPEIIKLTVAVGPPLDLGVDDAPVPPEQQPVPLPVEVC